MNSHTIVSIPVLSGEVFETLPESIRVYIRYLESRMQQLEKGWNIWDALADAIRESSRLLEVDPAVALQSLFDLSFFRRSRRRRGYLNCYFKVG